MAAPELPTVDEPGDGISRAPFGSMSVLVDRRVVRPALDGQLADALERLGVPFAVRVAEHKEDLGRLAAAALDGGARYVVAVGDDGSVADVAGGCFREGATIVEQPVLGVVPVGACELVRSFGLPTDLEGAVSHLGGRNGYLLDLMKVTTDDGRGAKVTTYGHNIALVGLRAAVARRSGSGAGGLRRFLAFWTAYLTSRPRRLTVHVDTKRHELTGWDVVVGNGQFAEAGMRLSPRSYPGDGILDALVFVGPKADAYRMLPKIFMNGGHVPDPGIKELRAKVRVTVEADRAMPVVLDGRDVGSTPATFQVVPQQVLLKI